MKKMFLFLAVLLALTACDKYSVSIIIEGFVFDGRTTQALANTKVELFTNEESFVDSTDENGYFNLGEFMVGDYTLILSKPGYSTDMDQIYGTDLVLIGSDGMEMVLSDHYYLEPLADKQYEITLFRFVEPNGYPLAAANFPYTITTGSVNSLVEGTTDANGKIILESVPENVRITIDHELNDYSYYESNWVNIKNTTYMYVRGYKSSERLGLVSANILDEDGIPVMDFQTDASITLIFTVPVDTAMSNVFVERDGYYDILFDYGWTENNRKLEINPEEPLLPGTNYEVTFDVFSEETKQRYNHNIYFMTEEEL